MAEAAEPAAVVLRGRLELRVDDQGLEAELVFSSDPEGPEWDPAKVKALLEREGVTQGIEERALGILFEAGLGGAGAPSTRTVVVARGTPPEPVIPAVLTVGEFAIRESLKSYEQRVMPADEPPAVLRRTVEKTRSERSVARKPLLPFLRARQGKQVVWEKNESLIPLEQPGPEQGRGCVRKGEVIATFTPARRARPGRSVFGGEIPAGDSGTAEGVYLGGALKQAGAEIRAEAAGFFRYGSEWIEHFPFTLHEHRVYASPDRLTCLLDFLPGSEQADPPTADQLLGEARGLGFPAEDLLCEDDAALLLSRALTDSTTLQAASLSRPIDAEIRIDIPEDRLSATLSLRKGRGTGRPLSLREVGEAIRTAGLKGMDTARVREDVLAFARGTGAALERYLLVQGREAQAGEDGRLAWKVPFVEPERLQALKAQAAARSEQLAAVDSLERFPLEAVEAAARVRQGDTVAELHPAGAGQAGADVFGAGRPGIKGREVRLELFENLRQERRAVVAQAEGLLETGSREETVLLRVRPHRDREIQVSLSADRMQGYLTLRREQGTGLPLEVAEVERDIAAAGIVKGLLPEVVSEAVHRALGGEAVQELLIARGQEPEHGQDVDLELVVSRASGQRVTLRDDGRADYRSQDTVTTVQAGTLLARMAAPTPGREGWDVSGRPVPARKGAARYIQVGKHVECRQAPDGSMEYLARIEGELDYRGGAIDVLQVHTVEGSVGLASGNVRFPGSVRVRGAVQRGFSVISGESIFVEESVQGALLSAAEAIRVEKGVVGEGKAVLRARTSIRAYFAEQATLLAVEDIRLTNACLRCTVKCNGKVVLESDKGSVIGGRVYCKLGLEAANLGSEREVPTRIYFGQDILVQDHLEREQRTLEELKVRNSELERAMIHAERTAADDPGRLESLRAEKRRTLQLIQMHSKRVFILQERFEQHFPSEIVVRGVVHPGVVLESHGRQREIKTPLREVVFFFNTTTGRIEERAMGA